MKNVLIVISGPSGVGKGTIAKEIQRRNGFDLSVSCTTRSPREGEVDGREYFFITKEKFKDKIEAGGFLEYSSHFDNFYGTPKEFVLDKLKNNDVILEIDVNGGLSVKENFKDAVLIMICPPSREEIMARLLKRNTDPLEKIKERMSRMDFELSKSSKYDYTVVNDNLNKCIDEIEKIIKIEKNK